MKKKQTFYILVSILSLLLVALSPSISLAATQSNSATIEEIPFDFYSTLEKDGSILTVFKYNNPTAPSERISLIINEEGRKETTLDDFMKGQNKELAIKGLTNGKTYNFDVKVINKKDKSEIVDSYSGKLIINIKEDTVNNTVYAPKAMMSGVYKNTSRESDINTLAYLYESEPNGLFSSANLTYDDYDNYGYISSTSDVDYYKVKFNSNGNANFWLGSIPPGTDFDLYI